MFNGSIRVLDTCGGGSNPPFLTMQILYNNFTVIKDRDSVKKRKVRFTDSNYREFEFWIYDLTIRFYYLSDEGISIYSISADLIISDVENNKFPESLNDFKEAKNYLFSYVTNIAFT